MKITCLRVFTPLYSPLTHGPRAGWPVWPLTYDRSHGTSLQRLGYDRVTSILDTLFHLFSLWSLALEEVNCHVTSSHMERPTWWETNTSCHSQWRLRSAKSHMSNSEVDSPAPGEPWDDSSPANGMPTSSPETLSQGHPAKPSPFPEPRRLWQRMTVRCFKLLSFGVIHYTVINN